MWLPEPSIYRTWFVSRKMGLLPGKGEARALKERRRVRRDERVDQYRAILEAEPGLTRAALARRLGVSRAWITRVLGPCRASV